jgi:hypothetical protein
MYQRLTSLTLWTSLPAAALPNRHRRSFSPRHEFRCKGRAVMAQASFIKDKFREFRCDTRGAVVII